MIKINVNKLIVIKAANADIYVVDFVPHLETTHAMTKAQNFESCEDAQTWLDQAVENKTVDDGAYWVWECDARFGNQDFYIVLRDIMVSYSPGNDAKIQSKGCSCCTHEKPLTKWSLDKMIADTTKFLGELVLLKEKL